MVKVIKTESQHKMAVREVEKLMQHHPAARTEERDRLELLALLVSTYEEEHFPVAAPTPIEAIEFRMEQQGLTKRDLVPYFGSRSRVSEVLSGKRPLTLRMIRALHAGLGIPAEALLQRQDSATTETQSSTEWNRFPIKEMAIRHMFPEFRGRPSDALDCAEELVTGLFKRARIAGVGSVFLRQHVRRGSQMDDYSLAGWAARVVELARGQTLSAAYKPGTIDDEFMHKLVRLSSFSEGPLLAKEFLGKSGIHFVVLSHLPRTHLDGAAMLIDNKTPVVAVTLRYDRLDNFWFCLCHELGHLALHIEKSEKKQYFDDLDAQGDSEEKEADSFAEKSLIPPRSWAGTSVRRSYTPGALREYAKRLGIDPAIVAGRIRKEQSNYRLLWQFVGNRQVRRHFAEYLAGVN
ncbi:MAG: ImmA/IrrE family metallo-endopeptidase [Candidatus Eisenbacteria bacterium]|nr:ImmA/IrrE family metallo-endopeptidase [Candidatus Eisenbacteria bacterium]